MKPDVVIEVMISAGFFTALAETLRWFLNRPKARIDDAKVVQGMAVDLLKPLHDELARANAEVTDLREKVREADEAVHSMLQWAMAAKALLDKHGIEYPELPTIQDIRG